MSILDKVMLECTVCEDLYNNKDGFFFSNDHSSYFVCSRCLGAFLLFSKRISRIVNQKRLNSI